MIIFKEEEKNTSQSVYFTVQANRIIKDQLKFSTATDSKSAVIFDSVVNFAKGERKNISVLINSDSILSNSKDHYGARLYAKSFSEPQQNALHKISYDHIPDINYNYNDQVPVLKIDLKTAGSLVGYIAGAGDKIPQALEQMGYRVVMLKASDITANNVKQFDAIRSEEHNV